MPPTRRTIFLAGLALTASAPAQANPSEADLWQAFHAGDAFIIMRHALAPGVGDPAGFRLDDCSTQRTLSDEGRQQARTIGERFRANGVTQASVFSSQWCRCRETARLLGLGPVQERPELNSFFGERAKQGPQTAALTAWIAAQNRSGLLLVTHQVNISALSGAFTGSGDFVVARLGAGNGVTVLGGL